MSNTATNWAWKVQGLTPAEKIVLLRLADRADAAGTCYPGQKSIAADCGLSKRTVSNARKTLIGCGLVSILRPPTATNSMLYGLNIEATPTIQPLPIAAGGEIDAGGEVKLLHLGGATIAGGEVQLLHPNHQGTISEPPDNPHTAAAGAGDNCRNGDHQGTPQAPSELPLAMHTLAAKENAPAPPPRAKSKPTRKRDALLDALLVATGTPDPTRATPQEIKAAAVALAGIRTASPSVTPEELARRARHYLAAWPNIRITPQGLAKHWSRFETGDLAKEAARLREEIAKHPANPSSIYHESDCPKAKRAEFRELRRRLAEIEARLGGGRHD